MKRQLSPSPERPATPAPETASENLHKSDARRGSSSSATSNSSTSSKRKREGEASKASPKKRVHFSPEIEAQEDVPHRRLRSIAYSASTGNEDSADEVVDNSSAAGKSTTDSSTDAAPAPNDPEANPDEDESKTDDTDAEEQHIVEDIVDESYDAVVQETMGPDIAAGVREAVSPRPAGRRMSLEHCVDWGLRLRRIRRKSDVYYEVK